ncbi:hypothetical protein PHJA_001382100 [Phtheirospermum japonicum]|uniref:Transmembrane protein n=1 Tax=Phtheirospermum japonicum TaxID=374723 RepID=A0A830BY38_9LAMI|nr:hypothetical protein PHJA_001382100 [Phtheirospermum japonicum]
MASCGYSKDVNDCIQHKLDKPMPWVGVYIATSSAACTIAMAADAFNGFRKKKLWCPCKYFSLNAFFLTVLAVAMKLPVDLTTLMLGVNDRLAWVSSLVLMPTAMANFMASLGSMEDNEILLNLAALCILVITIAGDVCIRTGQTSHFGWVMDEDIVSTVIMLLLLAILCSSAVMVPTAKRCIESQYNQMHKRMSNEQVNHIGKFTTDELRVALRRYWVMAESGSPQFVIARSVACVTSGLMCLLAALTLLEAHIRVPLVHRDARRTSSNYKWSIDWILVIQFIGVMLGTIAPLLRWFTAAHFKSTRIGHKSFKDEFKVETYWTQSLKLWRDSPSLPLKTQHLMFRKFLHDTKRLLLNFLIGVQILIVWASKLVLLVSAVFVKGLLFFFSYIKNSKARDSIESCDLNDLSHYVVLLEGEEELPKRTLKNICNEVDKLIQMGSTKQSKNLIKLLHKSVNFNGVREFDSKEIRSLNSQLEPPNCWSLPVVTLTSIAISLPNITIRKADQLLIAVSEGLYFAKLIEKTLDSNGELESIRNAADVVWVGVELYKKWQGKDLPAAGRTQKETLQKLSDIAEKTVTNFVTCTNNFLVQDPLNWPVKVIAANSMYRITQTILLAHDDGHPQTDEELCERLSIIISDILAACFTNLARVIMLKCHSNSIKEREKSIRQAALLLGESEKILEIVQPRELPNVAPKNAAKIEGWRDFMLNKHLLNKRTDIQEYKKG